MIFRLFFSCQIVYNALMNDFLTVYASRFRHNCSSRSALAAFLHERAWALLATALQAECNMDLSALKIQTTEHGKPYFANAPLRFNLSHCDFGETALVCCALSNHPVGVDCAAVRPYDDRLARRICTEHEYKVLSTSPDPAAELVTLWTQKESYRKLTGEGIAAGLKIEVPAQQNIWLHTERLEENFLLTLCTNHPPVKSPKLTLL